MTEFLLTIIGAALVNNLLLSLPLGIDVLLRAPAARARLQALGLATSSLMLLAVLLNHLFYQQVLLPLEVGYLRLLVFLPLGAALIIPVLAVLARIRPNLPWSGLAPLLLINGAVLGLALLSAELSVVQTLALSLGGGLGFWLVLLLFADLLERIDQRSVPAPFRGAPILLISAGLMGLALLGFNGLEHSG